MHPASEPQAVRIESRHLIVPALFLTAVAIFIIRLWYLQVYLGDEMQQEADQRRAKTVSLIAPRGAIYDRNGVMLAGVQPTYVVLAVPNIVLSDARALKAASDILGETVENIKDRLTESTAKGLHTPIFSGATSEQAAMISEAGDRLPSFKVEIRAMRQTRITAGLAHILGYVWKPNDKLVEKFKNEGIEPAEFVGREGLEMQYEARLMGEPGRETVILDKKGRSVSVTESRPPLPGDSLYLSLDGELQKTMASVMSRYRGAAVALDPQTGEVLGMVGAPDYDLKLFENGISSRDYASLRENPGNPLLKRPFQGLYSPGSTFKIVTAVSAARVGLLDYDFHEYCPGYKEIANRRVKCENHSTGRSMAFQEAFQVSCNTYFVDLALKVAKEKGPEYLPETARMLGLGEELGLDLPSEYGGKIGNGREVAESRTRTRPWYLGDTANMAIGQGSTLVTPLQMAHVTALVANRGAAYRPHLVRATVGLDGVKHSVEPEETARLDLPEEFWRQIESGMRRVVAQGTARRAQIPGVDWGGKTGSTQHSGPGLTHSWFVGVAPLENPKIVIAVLCEAAGHGGDVAAPLASQMVARYLQLESRREAKAAAASARTDLANSAAP